jgi:hypothetical protein
MIQQCADKFCLVYFPFRMDFNKEIHHFFLMYCDRFHDTSDMDAAIQRPGTDFGVPTQRFSFRVHKTEKYKSIATQCQQTEPILPRP